MVAFAIRRHSAYYRGYALPAEQKQWEAIRPHVHRLAGLLCRKVYRVDNAARTGKTFSIKTLFIIPEWHDVLKKNSNKKIACSKYHRNCLNLWNNLKRDVGGTWTDKWRRYFVLIKKIYVVDYLTRPLHGNSTLSQSVQNFRLPRTWLAIIHL